MAPASSFAAMSEVPAAEGTKATTGGGFALLCFAVLLLAVVGGSSEITVDVAGKSAPLYWTDLWALILFPLYVLWVERGRIPKPDRLFLLVAAALTWELIGLSRSADPLRGLRQVAIHGVGLIVYYFAARARVSRGGAMVLARLLVLAPLVLLGFAWASLGEATSIGAAAASRTIELGAERSNALATLFGVLGVLSLGAWAAIRPLRALAPVGIAAGALGLSLTDSRAGMLATIAGTVVLFFWLGGRGRRTAAFAALASAVVVVFALRAAGATQGIEERLRQPRSLAEGPIQNILIRLDYWRVSLEMFQASPVFGQGLGSFESSYLAAGKFTIDRPTDPHNQVMLLLGETGAPGAVLATLLAIALVARGWPRRDEPRGRLVRSLLLAGVVVAAVHSLAEPVFRNPSSVCLVALMLGLAANPLFYAAFDVPPPATPAAPEP